MSISSTGGVTNFNPRSREGSDKMPFTPPIYGNFNPRSREGSDFVPRYHRSMPQYFNPRSREGSDDLQVISSNRQS